MSNVNIVGSNGELLAPIDRKKLSTDLQAHAVIYARHFKIVPVWPGEKKPIGMEWQHQAWITPEVAEFKWQDSTNNIGLQLGAKSGTIDLECDGPDAEQDYLELFDNEPPIAPTYKAARGKHRLFADDPRLPAKGVIHYRGLEIRLGHDDKGAQSLLPPSVAKNEAGELVQRKWLPDLSPEEIPLAKLTDKAIAKILAVQPKEEARSAPSEAVSDPNSPGNLLKAEGDWERHIFNPLEASFAYEDRRGQHYRRKGKREGTSATVYADNGKCTIWTDGMPPFEQGQTFDLFTAYTILNCGGNFSEAAKHLRALGYVSEDQNALPDNAAEDLHKLYGDDGIFRGPLDMLPKAPQGPTSEDQTKSEAEAKPTPRKPYAFAPLTSAELARSQWPMEWIVKQLPVCSALFHGRHSLTSPSIARQ